MPKPDYTEVNAFCASLPENLVFETFPFGTTVLVGKDEQATQRAHAEGDECDMYTVRHSGFNHCWSSASVAASVRALA